MDRSRRKLKPIARKRFNFVYLLLGILFAIGASYIFLTYPPDYKFHLSNFAIPVLPVFFTLTLAFIFPTMSFLFRRRLQGVIFSLFIFFYFLLRLIGLTHWIFALLFLALFITVEFFVIKQK